MQIPCSISILIATYNYGCYKLASDVQKLLAMSDLDYEIIVAEDGSKDQVSIIANHKVTELPNCRHIINKENKGQARILNYLVREAKGEWCIFIDSDAEIISKDYISKYADYMKENVDIVIGGLKNPDSLPQPDATLRYKYEKKAEQFRTAEYRNKHPYRHFSKFNMMARRSVLLEIPFDERCTEYGYEDALMGVEMGKKGKKVFHIDNPLLHLGFDDNAKFLNKTETALRTLKKIEKDMLFRTHIGQAIIVIKERHLTTAVRYMYRLLKPLLRANLLSTHSNLRIFGFYKLGYYLELDRR